ncbi:flagellar basal body rod protein FlgB [Legionella lytica]|jgi:flagellar basal-body rod protein FlgB|uniref:Flagellar basal body rod protein FlgB n=1 Tax=Legionella lytica TaxID=96232 RepID=A0ABY4Y636_9GAMM|nr:flagellar basal body rod protein FlgB [Legionella lytica]USQ13030.1 flagellar basal body rod protein FlgB [Legionella lytica]
MSRNLDSYFGVHAKALIGRDQRASMLANNLANANTPNFKAQDVDFNSFLAEQMAASAQQMAVTSANHITKNGDLAANAKFRVTAQTALDGNTVDKDLETMEFARNSLNYQASLTFLNNKIKTMMLALKGE